MKSIILVGRSKAGKDEFYEIAKEAGYGFSRLSFADELKRLTAKVLNITLEELEANKEQYRKFLIYGGNLVREINPCFWVKHAIKVNEIDKSYVKNINKRYIVTDCRYKNEINYLDKTLGVYDTPNVVCIEATIATLISRGYNMQNYNHISETLVDDLINNGEYNALISNNTTLERYKIQVLTTLKALYGLPKTDTN